MLARSLLLASVLLAALALADAGAQPSRLTTIQVSNMHCANCARKIAGRLYTVPGVTGVRTDIKTHTALVTPQLNKDPSPRALWEAVEKAGFKPVRLQGPSGTFTTRPGQ